mgnify:CR=1 FL=1
MIKAYFHQFHLKSSSFLFPEYEVAICKEVSDFAEYYQIQPSNMYNIFDFATVLDMFLTVKSRTCGLSDGFFSAVMDHQPITITVCQNHVRVESHAAKDAVHLSKWMLKIAFNSLWALYGAFRSAGLVPSSFILVHS